MLYAESSKIILEGDNRVDIFIYHPENIAKQHLGNLYIVGEIASDMQNLNTFYFLNSLASIIKRRYYLSSKEKIFEALESALKKANSKLPGILNQNNIQKEKVSVAVAVFAGNKIYLTKYGDIQITIYRDGKWINVSRLITNRKEAFFGNITSGTIQEGDKIFLGTKSVSAYLEQEIFRRNFIRLPFTQAGRIIESKLNQINPRLSLALLKIDIKKQPKRIFSVRPLEFKADKQEQEQSKIQDSLLEDQELLREKQKSEKPAGARKLPVLSVVGSGASRIFSQVQSLYRKFPARLVSPAGLLKKIKKILLFKKHPLFGRPEQPGTKRKNFTFILIGLILLIILSGAPLLNQRLKYSKKILLYKEQLRAAEEKIQEAEQIFWKNPEKAYLLLKEAQKRNAKLRSPNKEAEAKLLSEKQRIEKDLKRLTKTTQIKLGGEMIDFQNLPIKISPVKLVEEEGQIFIVGKQGIYLINQKGSGGKLLLYNPPLAVFRAYLDRNKEKILLFSRQTPRKMLVFDIKTSQFHPASLNLPQGAKVADIRFYGGNTYILDTSNNQVWKFPGNSFEKLPRLWLRQAKTDLSDASSFSVDRSIYILKADGQILQFQAGKLSQNFKIARVWNHDFADSLIFSWGNFGKAYILKPSDNRLIRINKKGEILSSAEINAPLFLDINTEGKTMRLLTRQGTFEIQL